MTHFHTSNLLYKYGNVLYFQLDHSLNEDGSDNEESFTEYIGRRLSDSESIGDSSNVDDSEDQSIGKDKCPMSVSSENVSPEQCKTTLTLVGSEQSSTLLDMVMVGE